MREGQGHLTNLRRTEIEKMTTMAYCILLTVNTVIHPLIYAIDFSSVGFWVDVKGSFLSRDQVIESSVENADYLR